MNDSTTWHTLQNDWHGVAVTPALRCALRIVGSNLVFRSSRGASPSCSRNQTLGQFIEGLWEEDVSEFFLCEQGTTRYLEVNLAPTGAWWWCLFDEYRKRTNPQPPPPATVSATSIISANVWESSLSIPLSVLPFPIPPDRAPRINITGVITKPERHFLSYTKLQNDKPDFHLTKQFRPYNLMHGRPAS